MKKAPSWPLYGLSTKGFWGLSLSAHPTILHFLPLSFWRKSLTHFGLGIFVILTNKKSIDKNPKVWYNFGRALFGPGAPKFHYNTPSTICQLTKCTNLQVRKLPKFGYFANCI